jgi:hypothetical protein
MSDLSVFHCYSAKLTTLPDQPTLRVATEQQLCEHWRQSKERNAERVVERFGTGPDGDDGFYESACHGILEQEDFWQQCRLTVAWIDERPVWVSAADWGMSILPNPPKPSVRQFRLSLLGGGQIRVQEVFERMGGFDEATLRFPPELRTICYQPQLRVTTDAGDGLHRYDGVLSHGMVCEMATYAVLFRPGTPQSVADRTATTLRLINLDSNNFMALLDRSEHCCVCRRPLRDEVSKLLGIGPDCARQMGLPHNLTVANQILARRRELLGDGAETAEPQAHLASTT